MTTNDPPPTQGIRTKIIIRSLMGLLVLTGTIVGVMGTVEGGNNPIVYLNSTFEPGEQDNTQYVQDEVIEAGWQDGLFNEVAFTTNGYQGSGADFDEGTTKVNNQAIHTRNVSNGWPWSNGFNTSSDWFINTYPNNNIHFFWARNGSTETVIVEEQSDGSSIHVQLHGPTNSIEWFFSTSITTGSWHNIKTSWNGTFFNSSMKAFVNGEELTTTQFNDFGISELNHPDNFRWGRVGSYALDAKVDNLQFSMSESVGFGNVEPTSFSWNFNQTNAQNGYFSGSASGFTPHWWNWTFGDGSFSNGTISDVTHLYDSLGTFTVTLNASTINGSTFDTSTQTITVTELGNGTVTEVKDSELVFGLRTGWDPDSYKVWVRTSNPGNSLFGYDTNLNPDIDRSICTETDEFSNSRRDLLAVRVSGDRLVFSCSLNTGGGNAYIYDISSNSLTFAGTDGNDTATEFGWYNDNYINERSTGDELLLADLTEPGCGPTDANCVDVPIPTDTKHSAFDPGTLPSLTERLTCITGDNGSRCYRLNETSIIIQTERDDSLTFDWVQVYNNEVYFFSNDLVKTDKDFNTLQSSIGESTSGFLDPRMSKSGTFFTTYHRENGTIQVYDSETLELVGKSNTVPTIQYLDVTPDDEWVFGSNRTHLFRWNLSNIITNEGYVTENVQETSEGSGGSDTPNTLEDETPNSGFGADPANFAEEVGITVSSAAFLFTIILIMVLGGFLYVTMGNSRFMGTIGAFAGLGIGIAFSWVPLWIMYFIGLSIALVLGVLVFRRA